MTDQIQESQELISNTKEKIDLSGITLKDKSRKLYHRQWYQDHKMSEREKAMAKVYQSKFSPEIAEKKLKVYKMHIQCKQMMLD